MKVVDNAIFEKALAVIEKIFPLHRSISGDGINQAFEYLDNEVDGRLIRYPTGEQVFDWLIPQEWVCNDVSICALDESGESVDEIVIFDHPLRVASHSCNVNDVFKGKALKKKLVCLKKYPDNLSHRYIYYREDWSISVKKSEYEKIEDGRNYLVKIASEKKDGDLKVHEYSLEGEKKETIFLLSHLCHPAQFNDGLIGVLLNLYLYNYIKKNYTQTKYTYKFLAFPETIGSHAYCSNPSNIENALFAIFSEMTALDQPIHVQKSKNDADYVNSLIELAAKECSLEAKFSPFLKVIRNDEKVFNAPGINIPAASITRAWGYGNHDDHPYFGYHTDLDDIDSADFEKLKEVLTLYQTMVFILENDCVVERKFDGIPMLSRHNLFVDPLQDRVGYNIRESLVWQLSENSKLSTIALNLEVPFSYLLNILTDWESEGLVVLN